MSLKLPEDIDTLTVSNSLKIIKNLQMSYIITATTFQIPENILTSITIHFADNYNESSSFIKISDLRALLKGTYDLIIIVPFKTDVILSGKNSKIKINISTDSF